MGTRGAIGFVIGGKTLATYNHYDSYPSELGNNTLAALRTLLDTYTLDDLRTLVRGIRLVDESAKPTAEDIAALAPYTDLRVSNQSTEDWYCLMRGAQGDITAYLNAGVMIDSAEFLTDSLFCEYAYLINLDTQQFECYRGFNKRKPEGRYAGSKPKGWKPEYAGQEFYYGVGLIAVLSFDQISAGEVTDLVPIYGALEAAAVE
jgi:hypothetical protein